MVYWSKIVYRSTSTLKKSYLVCFSFACVNLSKLEACSWQSRHLNYPLYTLNLYSKVLSSLNSYILSAINIISSVHLFITSFFFFYRENLSKDLYLISQMDSDQFVPIWTIASMEGVKLLTTDMDLILEVLRGKKKKKKLLATVSEFVHS